MEDIIDYLEDNIRDTTGFGEDPDDISWGMEIGILISANQARRIVEALKTTNS